MRAAEEHVRVLESILSSGTDRVFAFAPDAQLIYANAPLLALWGLTPEQAIGRSPAQLGYDARAAVQLSQAMEHVLASLHPLELELSYSPPDGLAQRDLCSLRPVLSRSGSVELITGTSRALADDQTAQAHEARAILESISDSFLALDRAWRFTYVNHQAERVLGRARGELLGKQLWDEFPGLLGSDFEHMYRRAAEERVAGTLTAYYPDHDRWYEVHTFAAPVGISIYFRDVTEPRRGEEALRRSERRLREAHGLLEGITEDTDSLIAALDRDLRFTLINRAYHAALQRLYGADVTPGTKLTDALAQVPSDRTRALALWTRTLAGEHVSVTEECVGREPGRRVFDLRFYPLRDASGAVVGAAQIATDVTERDQAEAALRRSEEALREADRSKDQHIVGLAHELRNPLAPLRHSLDLIRLSGPSAIPRRMYEMMERQVDRLGRLVDDLLEVARKRSEAHAERQQAAGARETEPRVSAPTEPRSARAPRVLVVDDNRDGAESLGMLLTHLAFDVLVVHDGPTALAVVESYQPSLVLLDIAMPGMDGFEVASRIRQRPTMHNVVLVALTGFGGREDKERILAAGFDHHLLKPADVDGLQALLATLQSGDLCSN